MGFIMFEVKFLLIITTLRYIYTQHKKYETKTEIPRTRQQATKEDCRLLNLRFAAIYSPFKIIALELVLSITILP